MTQRIQRLVVRMLYDPGFRERIYAGLEPLDEASRAILTEPDPRAWTVDPHRVSRTLAAILDELPVSGALLGLRRARAFFLSEAFHAAIEGRGRLPLAFGAWAAAQVGPLATLELEMAHLRRTSPRDVPPDSIALGPDFRPVLLTEGSVAAFQTYRTMLGPQPLTRIPEDPVIQLTLGAGTEALLLERARDGGIGIGHTARSLYDLLAPLLAGAEATDDFLARARTLGADPGEDLDLLTDLRTDGVVRG